MRYLTKNILIAILIFFLRAPGLVLFPPPADKPEDVSISALVNNINEGNMENIIVSGNELKIKLKDGTEQKTRKEAESSLSESLANYGESPEALSAVNIELKGESSARFWMGIVIPFLLPVLIIGFFLWWMLRSAQKGAGQGFTFGKARARLIGGLQGRKQNITFKDVAGEETPKEELLEIVEFLKSPSKFLKMGA